MLYWLTEHLGIVLTAAVVSFIVLTVLTGRSVWRQSRRFERRTCSGQQVHLHRGT